MSYNVNYTSMVEGGSLNREGDCAAAELLIFMERLLCAKAFKTLGQSS